MNKQIEKFIDDAKLTAVAEMFEGELVDFAELIVRECMIISTKVDLNPYIPEGDQAKRITREIKNRFGVDK